MNSVIAVSTVLVRRYVLLTPKLHPTWLSLELHHTSGDLKLCTGRKDIRPIGRPCIIKYYTDGRYTLSTQSL